MKLNNSLVFCLVIFFSSGLYGQEAQDYFVQANILYKEGKFEAAMELYEKIPNKSAYVYYNLGNCAYKLKRYGWALLHWRRAERYWGFFNRDELLDNIMLLQEEVKKAAGIQKEKRSPIMLAITKIKNLIISWIRSTPHIIIQLLFLLLWLFLFIYIRFLYKKRKKWTIIALFALIAFFGILLVVRYSIDARKYGVVVSQQARLLSGPGETFQTLMQIETAQEAVIKKEKSDYYKVKVNKHIGWISKKDIEKT